MRILALDTSTGPASIALIDGTTHVANHSDAEHMQQSKRLVSATDALVRAHGGYEALDAMAVTTGPGGFTGIRVALAAARGLALACDVPLIGISSLETFAWQALHQQPEGTQAVAFVHAFRNQAYVQAFTRTSAGMQALCEAQAIDLPDTPAFATSYPEALLLGNAELPPISAYQHLSAPDAVYTAGYAAMLFAQGADALHSHPVEAFYIRPPDAKPQKPLLGA